MFELFVFSMLSTRLIQNYYLFQEIVYLFNAAKIQRVKLHTSKRCPAPARQVWECFWELLRPKQEHSSAEMRDLPPKRLCASTEPAAPSLRGP